MFRRVSPLLRRSAAVARQRAALSSTAKSALPPWMEVSPPPPGFEEVLFIESGCGTDQHGQDVTKACVRACKDAISFNSIPNLERLAGGRENVVLRVQLAVPFEGPDSAATPPPVDLEQISAVFPYGKLLPVELMRGGARFESMCSVPSLGDTSDSWVVAVACVTVGR